MRVALGCDHGGFPLKRQVMEVIKNEGHTVIDCGTFSEEAVDYPDYAQKVCQKITGGESDRGIIICGSGIGAAVAANKFKGIRAGTCHDTFSARQGVEDDDMNVLTFGARVIGPALAAEIVKAFLNARFSEAERHRRRLNKVLEFERNFNRHE